MKTLARKYTSPWLHLGLAALLLGPSRATAHVSEQAFVLLLPTQAYIVSGCLSVLFSIVIVAFIPKHMLERLFAPIALRLPRPPTRIIDISSLLSTVGFFVLCWIGVQGPRDPLTNLMPLFIWTGFWVVLFNAIGVLGNVWTFLNPWSGLFHLINGKERTLAPLKLPKWMGIAPAIVMFLVIFAYSIADPAPADPDRLAFVVMMYWLLNALAMWLFGCDEWMRRGEAFSVLFDQVSRVALFRWSRHLCFGFPGWQLARGTSAHVGFGIFALVLLGAGSFDGLKETFWWLALLGINPLEFPGRTAVISSSLVGMILCVGALIGFFVGVVWLGKLLGNRGATPVNAISFREMFCAFAPTILPIALAFHASHFVVTYLINGQYLLAAIGDPFARGVNFLGLGQARVTTGFLNTPESVKAIWLTQAGMVVFGHILAVVISHDRALRLFKDNRNAALSQIPLGVFMVLYTLFGLWLLATPRGV